MFESSSTKCRFDLDQNYLQSLKADDKQVKTHQKELMVLSPPGKVLQGNASVVDHFCYLSFLLIMFS